MKKRIFKRIPFFLAFIIFTSLHPAVTDNCLYADEHRYQRKIQGDDRIFFSESKGKKDKGNEFTGELSAWMLFLANFTVLFSIFYKNVERYARLSNSSREYLKRFNKFQKKHLRRLHYILNPVALSIALIHFFLSCCNSSSFPEWGLGGMAILMITGVFIKLGFLPSGIRKSLHRFHTSPVPVCLIGVILLTGHLIID